MNNIVIKLIAKDNHIPLSKGIVKAFDAQNAIKLEAEAVKETPRTYPIYDTALFNSLISSFKKINKDFELGKKIDSVVCQVTIKENLAFFADKLNKPLNIQNITKNKEDILDFIKTNEPFNKVYEVINEINKTVQNGIKVYLSGGNSVERDMKALRKYHNSSYYNFISTGKDDSFIERFKRYLNPRRYEYEFNLLNLSKATKVGIQNPHKSSELKQYPISAFDDTIERFEKGTFNTFPVRNKQGEVIGYNIIDEKPIVHIEGDWGKNDGFINYIQNFVGKNINEIKATQEEHQKLKPILKEINDNRLNGYDATSMLSEKKIDFLKEVENKLFKIDEIMDESTIRKERTGYTCDRKTGKLVYFYEETPVKQTYLIDSREMLLNEIKNQGEYTNCWGDKFFCVNDNSKVYYKKFNCEGTARPSVKNFHGTCLAALTAAIKDALNKT